MEAVSRWKMYQLHKTAATTNKNKSTKQVIDGIDNPLRKGAKANPFICCSTEHQRSFRIARVIKDVRPREGSGKGLEAKVIVLRQV